ncbi:sulfatase-like hydrolase/transferase [Streptomyces sp. A7024]|uniref:Sulfatase-like hydrolase/transferase n=1 Tax=Streptomyces coryli TaxID=1128680 RepID=A0A6G4TUH2_9ACTN|nr:sulfatase-like hydrolase/transferase [Streptomyces coryli]NGN62748.1 sulfatase-like hydrolase/transferase [Streptomyces coryli]
MTAAAPRTRPNVLILMSDEQRWDTLGHAGNPAARTSHLDALAQESTSFDACYTPFPLCCPSRTSLWTGRMPRHHHVLGNWRAIRPDLADGGLAQAFRAAGYHTLYCGKWHVPGTTPQRMGFADTAAIPAVLNGKDRGRYIEPYRAHASGLGYDLLDDHIENLTAADAHALRQTPHRGTARIPYEHFLEPWQTGEFLRALDRRPDDQPWLAVCSYNAPHFPMIVPEPYDRIIDRERIRLPAGLGTAGAGKPREVADSGFAHRYAGLDEHGWTELIAHYLGLCALIDTQVGTVLEHLRRSGDLDHTIVVFTSDHGDMMGAHGLMEKGHLLHYEEALRVPLLIRHPDATGGGVRTSNPVSVVDVAATLAELAGVPWDEADDGISAAAMVGAPHARATRAHVTSESVLYGMSADAAGQYVDPATWDPATDALNLSIRTPQLRYIYRSRDIDELYDHTDDPHEQHNRAAGPQYAAHRAELRRLLAEEVADVFGTVAAGLTPDKAYQLEEQ